MNPELNPQDAELAKLLERSAQAIQPSSAFTAELEDKLNNSQKPQRAESSPAWKNILPSLGWVASLAVLALVFSWAIKNFLPTTPQPASGATPTKVAPAPQGIPYDFNGTTLYLNAPLPAAQADMPIYSIRAEQFASAESVRALAEQFHMQGQLYKTPGFTQDEFLVVDGERRLQVRSDQYFTYYPDYPRWQKPLFVESKAPDAEAQIAAFFSENGFNFPYSVEYNEAFGSYFANAINPDGAIIVNESMPSYGARFHFDEQGIVAVEFSLLSFESVGAYGILSAEQALQIALSASSQRMQMGLMSVSVTPQIWYREYPFDETITYWGYMTSLPSAEGAEQLVTIDGYTATGNIADMPANIQFVFVQVTGQFHSENGAKTFAVDTWSVYDGYEDSLGGRIELTVAGPQVATQDRGDIPLAPLPTGFPIPIENAYISGVLADGVFQWKTIQDFGDVEGFGGGGGGGGGPGFFLINLSGTPVPLPTPEIFPTPIPFDQLPTGQVFEGLTGTLTVNIRVSEDGAKRTEYLFMADPGQSEIAFMFLEGDNLEALNDLQNRPLKVWGRLDHYDKFGNPILLVERYEVPYPDLQSQIIRGKITAAEVNGEVVSLFLAEDGVTYAMVGPNGIASGSSGVKGDGSVEMQAEVLMVPGETYAGYPALRVFSLASAFDENGDPFEMGMSSSEPNTFPENSTASIDYYLVVDKVELVYYLADQRYLPVDAIGLQPYIQPVWRFTGHTSDGSIFVILVQALQDIFLQPDPAYYRQPG